jgi:tetratricopeptide (TPR) repeat protein
MKNQIIILAFTFIVSSLIAQQKGINQLPTANRQLPTFTYAVVVGISDYQDPAIPDLRFADKDAEAFANYLRSNAGGKLDNDHLKVLINEKATVAQFAIQLDWLLENAKENDKVIIYFSGHGDVEKKTVSQPGYLLCWDAPARVYLAGGAMALPMYQDIITTLSTQNKSKVIVITDACRSGKLAGSSIGGSQITGANLAKQYSNEIKILSCQPSEYSIEGEQWGGGRGVFSYHLIDALYGLADKNNDLWVTLQEVGRYLEDHVSNEVAPVNQLPMMLGNGNERLTSVDEKLLASIKSGKLNQTAVITSIDSRGMEEEVLSQLDSSTRKIYSLFKKALKEKIFLEPQDACAEYYYQKLIAESKMQRLHSTITRNYAAALQDEAQQVLNYWLKSDSKELRITKIKQSIKYKLYPSYLQRAGLLLGEKHYMYRILKANQLFFEAYLMHIDNRQSDPELGKKILAKYRSALEWKPELSYVYLNMGVVHFYQLLNSDSSEFYINKASELLPNWVLPYSNLAFMYCNNTGLRNFDKAKTFLELADKREMYSNEVVLRHRHNWVTYYLESKQLDNAEKRLVELLKIDSANYWVYSQLATLCGYFYRYDESVKYYKKAIELEPTDVLDMINCGITCFEMNRYEEAKVLFKQAYLFDTTNLYAMVGLAQVEIVTGQMKEAEDQLREITQLDSNFLWGYFNIAISYFKIKNYEKSRQYFQKVLQLSKADVEAYYYLANIKFQEGFIKEAFDILEVALKSGFNDINYFMSCEELEPLCERKEEWNALLKKYFPHK